MTTANFSEKAVIQSYYTAFIPHLEALDKELSAKAATPNAPGYVAKLMGLGILDYIHVFNVGTFLESFSEKLTKLGTVDDPTAAARSQLGLRMQRYCSKHLMDIKQQRDITLIRITQAEIQSS